MPVPEPDAFTRWCDCLAQIYARGTTSDWPKDIQAEWSRAHAQMTDEVPNILVTWLDPSCGCCSLATPAVLQFDDPRGPSWFEVLYPAFKPTRVHMLPAA